MFYLCISLYLLMLLKISDMLILYFLRISDPSGALLEAFIETDDAFRKELISHRKSKSVIQKDWHPGCTAVVTLIVKNRLFVANAGDCRTILCQAGHPYALSRVRWNLCLTDILMWSRKIL